MKIADTDLLIDFLAGSEPGASRVAQELAGPGLATTVISRFELLSGARETKGQRRVAALLEQLLTLDLDGGATDRAAEVRRQLDAAGQSLAMADCLIAGIALSYGATLMTRNQRHFARVPDLILDRP